MSEIQLILIKKIFFWSIYLKYVFNIQTDNSMDCAAGLQVWITTLGPPKKKKDIRSAVKPKRP